MATKKEVNTFKREKIRWLRESQSGWRKSLKEHDAAAKLGRPTKSSAALTRAGVRMTSGGLPSLGKRK
jgi:hypothetical protein